MKNRGFLRFVFASRRFSVTITRMIEPIDLDQNATSPLDPEVLDAMRPRWLLGGNPESRHARGRASRRDWERTRETVAHVLNAEPTEVVFTSGGTEANNLAILGLALAKPGAGHIVVSPIEHPAAIEPIERLESSGFAVDRVSVGRDGLVVAELMAESLRDDTRLAALILAHNETGAIQDVARLAELAQARDSGPYGRGPSGRPDSGRFSAARRRDVGSRRSQVSRTGRGRRVVGQKGDEARADLLRRRPTRRHSTRHAGGRLGDRSRQGA